jgi:hypothetical protein
MTNDEFLAELPAVTVPPKALRNVSETVTISLAVYEDMRRRLARLERQAYIESWRTNPDRMGS